MATTKKEVETKEVETNKDGLIGGQLISPSVHAKVLAEKRKKAAKGK